MAHIYPTNIHEFRNESEKVFYQTCQKLSNDYYVFYSLSWFSKNAEGRKIQSECDFLIFNPHYGFLALEVKGGKKILIEGNNWQLLTAKGTKHLKKSPMDQANESMYYFRNYFTKEAGEYFAGIYGAGIVLPFYNVDSDLGPGINEELIISLKDLNNLEKRLIRLFNYHGQIADKELLKRQKDQFIAIINKRIALSMATGAIIRQKDLELEKISSLQDAIIDLLHNYKEAYFAGGAGTGKTYIAMKKLLTLSGKQKGLYLSYNYSLSKFVKEQLKEYENIEVYTFDSLICRYLGKKDTLSEDRQYFQQMKEVKVDKYDLIVIDEAQDFNDDWAKTIRLFLKKSGMFYVFGDHLQDIFVRDRQNENKFAIATPSFLLRHNIRNTKEIHSFIAEKTDIGKDIIPSVIEGSQPVVYNFQDEIVALRYLIKTITNLIEEELVEPSSITILSERKKENTFLKNLDKINDIFVSENLKAGKRSVRYSTVQAFKGLESDIVIFINYNDRLADEKEKNLRLYTAYSRAKYFLHVINIE